MQRVQQHLMFQNYLINCEKDISKHLKQKIIPRTEYEDYEFLTLLGQGSYGQVVSAQKINSQKLVAVKIIHKKNLIKETHLRHLISEIRILNSLKFEFLVSLECYFTNKCYVFMVMPFIEGISFSKFLKKVKHLEEDAAKFFSGQIVLALEYMHYMGIVYRDLKPENVILDVRGYVKIVDFGFAKLIGNHFSYTFCGTPEYIAPEILLSKGHNMSPDWWTLGIFIYELCNGSPPFTSQNHLKLYEKILSGQVVWPTHFSHNLKSIINGLLQVDRTKRLGCMKDKVKGIKFHKWFEPLDWIDLWNKKIVAPYRNFASKLDTSGTPQRRPKLSFSKCKQQVKIGNIDLAI